MLLRDIWDLYNLGQFDPNNQTIPLSANIAFTTFETNSKLEIFSIRNQN